MTVPVHHQWTGLDLSLLGRELSAVLGTPRLTLLHAWGNIIYADGTYVYKLTAAAGRDRCERSLRALALLLDADPEFPTVFPASWRVQDIDLGPGSSWALTIWPRMRLSPVKPRADETESYRELGRIVRRLHSVRIPRCPRHDPLVWARGRVNTLLDPALREALEDEARQLEQVYAEAFPPAADVTVHGDLHWEQVARGEQGRLLLLDFEHTASGPSCTDLVPSAGWLRRTGHPSGEQTAALAEGYGNGFPKLTTQQSSALDKIAQFSRKTWELLQP